ncbi:hypothetical protein [Chitinibacter sp. GC72]|uniref:hypothetical protein n=1 Tax=Chitinibacter sp. GC72 TaxID=1526917 RepID=UPI0012FA81AF|nr:hypothetical protein [Chitinibacter sp. GC72]
MIPEEVLTEIIARVKREWPNDRDMQKFCISEEKEAYTKIQAFDFGDLAHLKNEFIESARSTFDAWDDTFNSLESELDAYRKLLDFSVDGLALETIEEWRLQALQENEGYYEGQLDFLQGKARKHASIVATREQIDPIKTLLIELEKIIGSECYNGSIQNYGSWGELESVGRQFRYPVKFYNGSGEKKLWSVSPSLPSEELITGYYAFGANELNVYRALFKIVSHLRENYGLKV